MTRGKVAVCESTVGQAETRGKGRAIDDGHDDDDDHDGKEKRRNILTSEFWLLDSGFLLSHLNPPNPLSPLPKASLSVSLGSRLPGRCA
jgi:hypothetical protein